MASSKNGSTRKALNPQQRAEEKSAAEKEKAEARAIAAAKAKEEAAAKKAAADAAKASQMAEAEAQAAAAKAAAVQEAAAMDDLVDVVVPNPFRLVGQDHRARNYAAGTYPMPRAHAEHWFSKANGVKIYKPVSQE